MKNTNRNEHALLEHGSIELLEYTLHSAITRSLYGLVPDAVHSLRLQTVLDLHCRSGAWAVDFAQSFPAVHVIGVDEDEANIEMARQRAAIENNTACIFQRVDFTQPLPFAGESVDFIHALAIAPLLRPARWSALLLECRRVLKVGGSINLIGLSLGPGSSLAHQQMLQLEDQLYRLQGYGFADPSVPYTSNPGVYFPRLLQQADFREVAYRLAPIDYGTPAAFAYQCNLYFLRRLQNKREYVLQQQLISELDFDRLIEQRQVDLVAEDYCAAGMLVSVTATKE